MTENNEIAKKKLSKLFKKDVVRKRESIISQKSREFKKKDLLAAPNAAKEQKKININISQNININTNLKPIAEYNDNDSKNMVGENQLKFYMPKKNNLKLNSCIYYADKEKEKKMLNNRVYLSGHLSIEKSQSRGAESSIKLDKLSVKQTKIETRDTRDEQYFDFYINDNRKNLEYKLKNNCISTTKYNVFNFIPKGLLFQFSRLSNVYFLFTAIIQSIPIISPLTSLTAIVPLIFVLGISMIREAIEDLGRHNYDNLNNEEEVIVLRDNKFVKTMSETLKNGEIILLYENKNIPADMILIDSGFSEGTCYVETSSLDGEKTLKLKVANKYTQGFISNDIGNNNSNNKNVEKFLQNGKYYFSGYVKLNTPNADLNYINGTVHAFFQKEDKLINQDIYVSTNEFLLKGSVLKNTNWIIGIVAYTGMNNKIILNSKKPRLKMSKVEKSLNYYLLFIFIFLMICCVISSIYHHFFYLKNKKFYDNFIFINNSANTESFIIFFTYFLLLNTMIPISLIVSLEIIKMIQGIYMNWDILLYSKWRHCFCGVKSVSIIEELGNVNFIFSDKTGTLTKNQLQFKYCIIENKFYEYIKLNGTKLKNNTSMKIKGNIKKKSTKCDTKKNYKNKKSVTYTKVNHDLSNNSKILLNNQENSSFIDDEPDIKKNNESKSVSVLNNNNRPITVNNVKITKNNNLKDNFNTFIVKKDCFNFNNHKETTKNNKKMESTNKANNQLYKTNSYSNSSNNKNSINFGKQSLHSKKICENRTEYLIHNSDENEFDNENNISESDDSSEISQRENSISSDINKIKKNIEEQLMKGRNSTILEAKNEDYESVTLLNEITKFGEGFFASSENNPIIGKFSSKASEEFNYIHEFWKALSLTNECMIKEEQGEIKYMGTSPDDLELVKAASLQGYKLIETTINTKTIRISRKDYSYEILKVIGFSSERKRMSIIVKDELGIKLYIKGADCEISKRLSKKSLESENYKIISNGLVEFSKKGLRTLMVAYRKINEEDYNSWVNRLHEDEMNIQSKQKMIDKLYDIVENNLILIGGTVVEDKLQDKVPETIKEIRAAGIKIWVLTGDKLDTAENIGHSCNLLSKEQRLFTLKVMPGDDEKVKENPYDEMMHFFSEFQDFIEGLVKKYNLETKYSKRRKHRQNIDNENNYNMEAMSDFSSPGQNSSNGSNNSEKSKIIDFETFNYLKEKKILEPFSIIIEAPILCGLFKDEEWTERFLSIAYHSNTVICCRVSPSQKSQVIQKMKSFDRSAITLAIGDGGNDVSMIMEANIGIGIYGEEGLSAAQASDFSIGEFQLLKRLLFIHGRINLFRISKMILYFFYKNFVFTMCQLYFAFICLASGQTFIDDWYITCYNLIFTALPLCVSALSDTDLDIKNGREKKNLALLYKENRDKYKIFSFPRFIFRLIKGIIISLFIFILCCVHEILKNGRNKDIWYLSVKTYTSVLIVVSINLMMNSDFIICILPLSIGITTFLFYGIFLVMNHYGFLFNYNSKASVKLTFNTPLTYLNIFLICSFSFIVDYTTKLSNIFFSGSLSLKLILKKALKSDDRKSLYGTARFPKPYPKLSKKRSERRNPECDDKSRTVFIPKSPKKSYNSIKFQECNTPKAFNNNKYKVGPDYKNDFFSLRLLKVNNNSSNIESKSNKKNNDKLDGSNDQ